MKVANNYQRCANYLHKIFTAVNQQLFNGELDENTAVTIQSSAKAYGHCTVSKVWERDDGKKGYEINISADYLSRPIENTVATMIHECVHEYCMIKGIKDTSNNGRYHNRRFKEIAEKHLITVENAPTIGWSVTSPTEELLQFCLDNGFEDLKLHRASDLPIMIMIGGKSGSTNGTPSKPRNSHSIKYICPCCRKSFRATRNDLHVLCMDCNKPFESEN